MAAVGYCYFLAVTAAMCIIVGFLEFSNYSDRSGFDNKQNAAEFHNHLRAFSNATISKFGLNETSQPTFTNIEKPFVVAKKSETRNEKKSGPRNGKERCGITLVTAYFEVRAKYPAGRYKGWIRNLMALDACFDITTETSWAPVFMLGRNPNRTNLQTVDLDTLAKKLNKSSEFWIHQHELDGEHHPSFQLYIAWTLKFLLVPDAAKKDIFWSEYFFWIDAGYLRDSKYNGRALITVPENIEPYMRTTLLCNIIRPFRDNELASSFVCSDHIGGGMWGGSASVVFSFCKEYFRLFEVLQKEGKFVGKDQCIMNTACVLNKGLCALVKPDRAFGDTWFFLVPLLLGDVKRKDEDLNSTIKILGTSRPQIR